MGWDASLELDFRAAAGVTHLARRAHRGPLYVQRPFAPEGAEGGVCHVYLLHPPGGLVGGDAVAVEIAVGEGAAVLVTTPSAGKAYRTRGLPVGQRSHLKVAANGSLEWLPQEMIVYNGADATLDTRVTLAVGARFVGAEMICFGLPARNEPFARGTCQQVLEIHRDGVPLLIERARFVGGGPGQTSRWGLGGATVLALLTAAPAPAPAIVDELRTLASAAPAEDRGAVTVLGDGDLLVCRYLGASAERARTFQQAVWRCLRPGLLGRAAVPPRIWAT